MSESSSPIDPAAGVSESSVARDSQAQIDASCRAPVLVLFGHAVFWLVAGLVLALIASIKMHGPGFLADCPWLTYGRVRPAAMNSLLYGFASQAGLGVLLWMMCRLGGVRMLFPIPTVVGALLWNFGCLVGVVGILAGGSTGFEWLEMPTYAARILFVAYAVIGTCAVVNFTQRRDKELYVSQWYLLAALFWFPWVYSLARLLLVVKPVRGTMQSAINAWFAGNVMALWLVPLALAVIYYFVPKAANRPLANRGLAAFGFWTYAVFASFSALVPLIGGPVPRWMTSLSTAASVCGILPLVCLAMTWHETLHGSYGKFRENPALQGSILAGGSFLFAGVLQIALAFPQTAAHIHFTFVPVARGYLLLLGCAGMAFLGAYYYILPRLTQIEWPSASRVRLHLLLTFCGIVLVVVPLLFGGLLQGARMHDPKIGWTELTKSITPLIGLSTLGFLVLLAGQFVFAVSCCGLMRKWCEPYCRAAAETVCGCKPMKAGAKA